MAYLGTLVFLVAALGAWFYRRGTLERHRWFLWTGVTAIAFPYLAALAGWMLSEIGRQPWIVQGLLQHRRRQLAQRRRLDDRRQPGRVRHPLR